MPIPTDLLITNANAISMDRARPRAEAVGVRGSRIVFVGSNAEAAHWRGPQTRTIDAQGYTLLPGLIDSHYHLIWGSLNLDDMHFEQVTNLPELAQLIRERAATTPSDGWLVGFGLNYNVMPAGERLTRHHLDRIVADRPMYIQAFDYHTGWANTKALEMAGILHGAECPAGNEIVMDADGTASGELREFVAYEMVKGLIPPPDEATTRARLRKGLKLTNSFGITSVHNMDGNLEKLMLLSETEQAGDLTVRVYLPYSVTPKTPFAALADEAVALRDWLGNEGMQSEMLRAGAVKFFMDGVIESFTSLMIEEYALSPINSVPGNRGSAIFEAEHFTDMAVEADRLGLQIVTHAIGDGAIRRTLDGYEAALRTNGRRDSRHRIEHVELLHADDLPRFRQLGVIASMQPLHAGFAQPGEAWCHNVGESRWDRGFLWQTLRKSGVHLSFGSDWPVVTQNPFFGFHTAINRKPWLPGQPSEAQSLFDTLAGYTRDAAYTEFQEGVKGQLRAGMYADLVLFQGNIETIPPSEVQNMKAALTVCGGRVVFEG